MSRIGVEAPIAADSVLDGESDPSTTGWECQTP